jgi:hypothetical protein
VGVQTPRGTGTSGYVQANMSYRRKIHSKLDFLKELRKLRENQLKPDNKPDQRVLEHNKKRAIYLKLQELRRELQKKGKDEEYISRKIRKKEKKLIKEFEETGDIRVNFERRQRQKKDDHARAEEKQKQLEKMKEAFGLEKMGYKEGTAFDFEMQEKEKLERIYQRKLRKFEKKKLKIEAEEKKQLEEEKQKIKEEENEKEDDAEVKVEKNEEEVLIKLRQPEEENLLKDTEIKDEIEVEQNLEKQQKETEIPTSNHFVYKNESEKSERKKKKKSKKTKKIKKKKKKHKSKKDK